MLNQTLSYIEKILTVSALLATSTSLPEYGHLTSLRSGSKYIAASIWEKNEWWAVALVGDKTIRKTATYLHKTK